MKKPQDIHFTLKEIVDLGKEPPAKVFWDFLPARLLGFLRRFFNIAPTPLERWFIGRSLQVFAELLAAKQDQQAISLVDEMLANAAKEPPEDKQWN